MKKESPKKSITVTEQGLSWQGFANLYEILGFVELHMRPDFVKSAIMESIKKEPPARPRIVEGLE